MMEVKLCTSCFLSDITICPTTTGALWLADTLVVSPVFIQLTGVCKPLAAVVTGVIVHIVSLKLVFSQLSRCLEVHVAGNAQVTPESKGKNGEKDRLKTLDQRKGQQLKKHAKKQVTFDQERTKLSKEEDWKQIFTHMDFIY